MDVRDMGPDQQHKVLRIKLSGSKQPRHSFFTIGVAADTRRQMAEDRYQNEIYLCHPLDTRHSTIITNCHPQLKRQWPDLRSINTILIPFARE